MAEARPAPPLRVFVSYSHHDDKLCERFLVYLGQLERQGLIEPWEDRSIVAGEDWDHEINESLDAAHVIVLLVSADFLTSDYCNDVEMKRALDRRHESGVRVVPVILKRCEWQTSPLGSLQALPKGGVPVEDWKTNDRGFDNVVKGLRGSIRDLCGHAPVGVQVAQMAVRRHPWRWAAGALSAALLLALYGMWSNGQRYLKQGTDLLNVGRYADARPALQSAKRFNPLSGKAGCGLDAVELDALRSDRVRFEQRSSEASREHPGCAYLKVLTGDEKYRLGDRKGALAEYAEAVKREPKLAEAYFDMGRILDLEDDRDSALKEYEKAVQLSSETPRYSHNLGDLYFRHEEYDKALEAYGRLTQFPLAAIEAAKIYRLQGKLENARGREEDAVRWLKDPVVKSAEEQNAWAFDVSPIQQVQLRLFDEKQCYADLELAVTTLLQGDDNEAAGAMPAAFTKCRSRQPELKDILKWELRTLDNQSPALAPRSEAIVQRYLKSGS
ncbi:MAG TPA: toll/interleukin-1 receptor domain-containing protein [Bryobacteraceae bacterium]|nr:toll/interleukin-1 receptor domain-containing protein [Bryobacteraceae bacterium]